MKVTLINIQGFKGVHSFTLTSGINEITAKRNGTGKTTFFECIKLLVNEKYFTPSNQKYILNLKEVECSFMVELDDVIYGFRFTRQEKLTYFRQYKFEGAEYETQTYPFDTCADALGVYLAKDTYVNILDKTSNLFSSSRPDFNYELITQIFDTTRFDEKKVRIELYLEGLKESLKESEKELIKAKASLNILQEPKPYKKLELLVDKTRLGDIYECLNIMEDAIHFLKPYKILKGNVNELEYLNNIFEGVSNIKPYIQIPDSSELESLGELLNSMSSIEQYSVIKENPDELENLIDLNTSVIELKQFQDVKDIEPDELLNLIELKEWIYELKPHSSVKDLETRSLEVMFNLDFLARKLHKGLDTLDSLDTEIEVATSTIENYINPCPKASDKRYLIEGKCYSL